MKFPEPREFQTQAIQKLRNGFVEGKRKMLLVAPTGAGKTYLALNMISQAVAKGSRCLFLADRRTLIRQTYQTALKYGMRDLSIMMGDSRDYYVPHARVQIASAQTIDRRGFPIVDLVFIDEAHTRYSVWTEWIKHTKSRVIGLTATPFSPGLADDFEDLVNAATMAELTQSGVLVPMRVFTAVRPDMRGAKKIAGEYSDKEASERSRVIVGDVVTEWHRRAENRKTIGFGVDIAHCAELCRQFNDSGVTACMFTSKTTEEEREEILREFEKEDSAIKVLLSVEALAKGFDCASVSCVIDARPLAKSLSAAIQMWGRGLRSHPGKTDCILIDHSGNRIRFAEDFEEFFYSGAQTLKEASEKEKKKFKELDDKETSGCPKCGASPFARICTVCGYESKRLSLVEALPGETVELNSKQETIGKQHFYSMLKSHQVKYGLSDGWVSNQYREKFGVWPRGMKDIYAEPTKEFSNYMLSKYRQYKKLQSLGVK